MIKRTENGQTTLVLHKQLEHHLSTGLYQKYYSFNGQVIALRDGLNLFNPVTFFVADHLGSISTTIWAGGSKRSDLRYDPWGKARWSQTSYTIPTGHRYTSQRWEDKLGLYDYNARYYDPTTARFLSRHSRENGNTLIPDPANPQSFNRYAYVLNNPLKYTDSTGHYYYEPGCDCLVDTGNVGNEFPDNLRHGHGVKGYGSLKGGNFIPPPDIKLPDGIALGIQISFTMNTPLVNMAITLGRESLFNLNTLRETDFAVLGWNIQMGYAGGVSSITNLFTKPNYFGGSATVSGYVSSVYQLESNNLNYAGQFVGTEGTISAGWGITLSEAHGPDDVDLENAYSKSIGLTAGYGLTYNASYTYYIPIRTRNGENLGQTTYHNPVPYVRDLFNSLTVNGR